MMSENAHQISGSIDSASELISELQIILKNLKSADRLGEEGVLQQFLDEENLYIKQIPTVLPYINFRMQIMFTGF